MAYCNNEQCYCGRFARQFGRLFGNSDNANAAKAYNAPANGIGALIPKAQATEAGLHHILRKYVASCRLPSSPQAGHTGAVSADFHVLLVAFAMIFCVLLRYSSPSSTFTDPPVLLALARLPTLRIFALLWQSARGHLSP